MSRNIFLAVGFYFFRCRPLPTMNNDDAYNDNGVPPPLPSRRIHWKKSAMPTRKVILGDVRTHSELAWALGLSVPVVLRPKDLFTKKDKKEPLGMAGAASVGQCTPSPFSREREGRRKSLAARQLGPTHIKKLAEAVAAQAGRAARTTVFSPTKKEKTRSRWRRRLPRRAGGADASRKRRTQKNALRRRRAKGETPPNATAFFVRVAEVRNVRQKRGGCETAT